MELFGIELSTFNLWLLGIAGACIAFLFQIWIARHSRKAAAAAKFRSCVLEALKGLYPIPSGWFEGLDIARRLEDVFPELQTAVEEFRPYLSRRDQARFDLAWKTYRVGPDYPASLIQDYWQYRPHIMDVNENGIKYHFDNTNTYRSDFKLNVDNLIAFASDT